MSDWPISKLKRARRCSGRIARLKFRYLGLQTLYDRYFLHIRTRASNCASVFHGRVAMGLALNEIDRETRAIEFTTCCPRSTS